MANVREYVEQILAARYGEQVRGSIANSILAMNTEAEEAHTAAIDAQDSASASAAAAATSASNAATSETNAHTSELNAAASAASVAGIVEQVTTQADNARNSAQAAAASETAAAASQLAAGTSASNAATSETNARNYAEAAQTSANSASGSATTAQNNSASAQTAANNAANSATAAAQSAQAAADAAAAASAASGVGIATTAKAGMVRPDGVSIQVNEFGTISTRTEFVSRDSDDPTEYLDYDPIASDEADYLFKNKVSAISSNQKVLRAKVAEDEANIGTLQDDVAELQTSLGDAYNKTDNPVLNDFSESGTGELLYKGNPLEMAIDNETIVKNNDNEISVPIDNDTLYIDNGHIKVAFGAADRLKDFKASHTAFNANGSITETDGDGWYKITTFGDNTITETLYNPDDVVKATLVTTFNADGSIDAVPTFS